MEHGPTTIADETEKTPLEQPGQAGPVGRPEKVGYRGSEHGRRRRDSPAHRRARGYTVLGLIGVMLLIGALLAGSWALGQVNARLEALRLPTPVPTPDIAPLGAGPVVGPPSVDVALIRRVLRSYESPATDEAQTFYDLGVERGIDPAYCLAFFIVESAAGTQGVARITYSIGNIRALPGQPSYEGYRFYDSWRDGIADWYRLIDELYVHEWGLMTLDAIVPVYAPRTDNNDEAAYILTIKRLVARWRGY